MINVKVFNERKGYIHSLKSQIIYAIRCCITCQILVFQLLLCHNFDYELYACQFNGTHLRNVMYVVIYCVLMKCQMHIRFNKLTVSDVVM